MTQEQQQLWREATDALLKVAVAVEKLRATYRKQNDTGNVEMLQNFVQAPLNEVRDTLNAL